MAEKFIILETTVSKIIIDNPEEAKWDRFLVTNSKSTFLQSYGYGEFYKELGYKIWRLGLTDDQGLIGVCLLVKLSTKLGSFIYCPGGPVNDTWKEGLEIFLEKAVEIGKAEKVSFIRFDPRAISGAQEKVLLEKGLVKTANYTQPQCTQILDLTKSLDEIRKNFSDSTRYNIGWVERKGVRVKISQNPAEVDIFVNLLKETAQRQHFRLYAKENYYKKQYLTLRQKNMAKLFLAYEPEKDGQEVLAAAIVIDYGETATYLHSASSGKNPKLRAPYLMQWKIIEDAKNSGLKKYDFWGVAKDNNPADPWAGVTEFKRSFGGEKICYQKPFDLILTKGYYLETIIEKGRLVFRKLKI